MRPKREPNHLVILQTHLCPRAPLDTLQFYRLILFLLPQLHSSSSSPWCSILPSAFLLSAAPLTQPAVVRVRYCCLLLVSKEPGAVWSAPHRQDSLKSGGPWRVKTMEEGDRNQVRHVTSLPSGYKDQLTFTRAVAEKTTWTSFTSIHAGILFRTVETN